MKKATVHFEALTNPMNPVEYYLNMVKKQAIHEIIKDSAMLVGSKVILNGYKGEITDADVCETLILDTKDLMFYNVRFNVTVEDATNKTYILSYKEMYKVFEDMINAKPDGNEESVIIKPEVKTDSKPKIIDKNVARKDGKVIGNLEELTDKVLKAKRENPKLSWVKLINSLQLLRQDGYKIRRSSYFQNQLTENEKDWALKSTAK